MLADSLHILVVFMAAIHMSGWGPAPAVPGETQLRFAARPGHAA